MVGKWKQRMLRFSLYRSQTTKHTVFVPHTSAYLEGKDCLFPLHMSFHLNKSVLSRFHHMYHSSSHHPTKLGLWSRSTSSERVRDPSLRCAAGAHTQTRTLNQQFKLSQQRKVAKFEWHCRLQGSFQIQAIVCNGEPTASERPCLLENTVMQI